MRRKRLLIMSGLLIFLVVAYIKSCAYLPIKGTAIDSETKQPIEGAVVLADWTVGRGLPGLSYTDIYKVVETLTDRNGHFKIDAYVLRPFTETHLTIYKAGYVCWNNEFIFPGYKHREGFRWENNNKYELEKFKKEYSYADHVSFIDRLIPALDARDPFNKAYEWEAGMRQKEWGDKK